MATNLERLAENWSPDPIAALTEFWLAEVDEHGEEPHANDVAYALTDIFMSDSDLDPDAPVWSSEVEATFCDVEHFAKRAFGEQL